MKKLFGILIVFTQLVVGLAATDIKDVLSFSEMVNKASPELLRKYDEIHDEDESLRNVFIGYGNLGFNKYTYNRVELYRVLNTLSDSEVEKVARAWQKAFEFLSATAFAPYGDLDNPRRGQYFYDLRGHEDSLIWKIFMDKGVLLEKNNGVLKFARGAGLQRGTVFTLNETPDGLVLTMYEALIENNNTPYDVSDDYAIVGIKSVIVK